MPRPVDAHAVTYRVIVGSESEGITTSLTARIDFESMSGQADVAYDAFADAMEELAATLGAQYPTEPHSAIRHHEWVTTRDLDWPVSP